LFIISLLGQHWKEKREKEKLTEQDPQLQLEQSPLQEQVVQVLLDTLFVSKESSILV